MVNKQTSGALHNDRLTSQVSGAAPGGSHHAERAAAMAPHQWTLQFLIAVVKNSDEKIGPRALEIERHVTLPGQDRTQATYYDHNDDERCDDNDDARGREGRSVVGAGR
jgi:hypothetical protein